MVSVHYADHIEISTDDGIQSV